jgi:hypothetical protein
MLVKNELGVLEKAMALGDKHEYYFRAMPNIGVISGPVTINRWRFIPLAQDNTPLPAEAQARLDLLIEAGFPIKQVIIGHEPKKERKPIDIPAPNWETIMTALRGIGLVLWAVGRVIFYALITALSLVDPALIVIFEGEERWMLCIANWPED